MTLAMRKRELKTVESETIKFCTLQTTIVNEIADEINSSRLNVQDLHRKYELLAVIGTKAKLLIERMEESTQKYSAELTEDVIDEKTLLGKELLKFIDEAVTQRAALENFYMDLRGVMTKAELRWRQMEKSDSPPTSPGASFLTAPQTIIMRPATDLPTFDGRIEDFANFWQIFCTTVDDDPTIPAVQKFSLLKKSLRGEAQGLLSSYLISEDNYEPAKERLKSAFGDDSRVVNMLHRALEEKKAKSCRAYDQRQLLYDIQAVTAQLKSRRQIMDVTMIITSILRKFNPEVQRKITERSVTDAKVLSSFDEFIKQLEVIIKKMSAVEEMQKQSGQRKQSPEAQVNSVESRRDQPWRSTDATHDRRVESSYNRGETYDRRRSEQDYGRRNDQPDRSRNEPSCCFCKRDNHRPRQCLTVRNTRRRLEILNAERRCHICFRKGHTPRDCQLHDRKCFKCDKKYHSAAVCTYGSQSSSDSESEKRPERKSERSPDHRRKSDNARVNSIRVSGKSSPEEDSSGDSEVEVNATTTEMKAVMPVARVTVAGSIKPKKTAKVTVAFDTFADTTFIKTDLAAKMNLQKEGERKRLIKVFGKPAEEGIFTEYSIVMHTSSGKEVTIRTLSKENLTGAVPVGKLTNEDRKFIRSKRIRLAVSSSEKTLVPDILLGQDYLTDFLDAEKPQFRLPSGTWLTPTVWGYVKMGKAPIEVSKRKPRTEEAMISTVTVNTVQTSLIPDSPKATDETGIRKSNSKKKAIPKEQKEATRKSSRKKKRQNAACKIAVRQLRLPTDDKPKTADVTVSKEDKSGTQTSKTEVKEDKSSVKKNRSPRQRKRQRRGKKASAISYDKTRIGRSMASFVQGLSITACLFFILFGMPCVGAASIASSTASTIGVDEEAVSLHCINGGAEAVLIGAREYTICGEIECYSNHDPGKLAKYFFSPRVVTRDYTVRLKFVTEAGQSLKEVTCPAADICDAIQCRFCMHALLNPGCSPLWTAFFYAWLLIIGYLGMFACCKVPLVDLLAFWWHVVQRSCMISCSCIARSCQCVYRPLCWLWRRVRRRNEPRFEDLEQLPLVANVRPGRNNDNFQIRLAFAVILLLSLVSGVGSCLEVQLKDREHVTCNWKPGEKDRCLIQLDTEMLFSWLQGHNCLIAKYNDTKIAELRVTWKKSISTCHPKPAVFTRNIRFEREVTSACGEECPDRDANLEQLAETTAEPVPQFIRALTCRIGVCSAISNWFYITKLIGYPKGRDVYSLRVSPTDDKVYSIEECNEWSTDLIATASSFVQGEMSRSQEITVSEKTVASMGSFRIWIKTTEVGEYLGRKIFIRSEDKVWVRYNQPYLQPRLICSTEDDARLFRDCELAPRCRCPDYIINECDRCENENVGELFDHTEHTLPIGEDDHWLREEKDVIFAESSTPEKVVLHVKLRGTFSTTHEEIDQNCSALVESIRGCYSCPAGAVMTVIATYQNRDSSTHLRCGADDYAIIGGPEGTPNKLTLMRNVSNIRENCTFHWGRQQTTLSITAELHYLPPNWDDVKKRFWRRQGIADTKHKTDFIDSSADYLKWISSWNYSQVFQPEAAIKWATEKAEEGKNKAQELWKHAREQANEMREKMTPDWLKAAYFLWRHKIAFTASFVLLSLIATFAIRHPKTFLFGLVGSVLKWVTLAWSLQMWTFAKIFGILKKIREKTVREKPKMV